MRALERENQLQEPIAVAVERYATFIQSTPDHVVNSVLKIVIRRDVEFRRWRKQTRADRKDGHVALDTDQQISTPKEEYPLTVREAAKYLGVSPQTVYLWVERKQIPHLRVMSRNIRFLKSELETFRASFKQEIPQIAENIGNQERGRSY
ncbi:MAG: hypothetical protein DMG49_23395 [Acidobacteria bacterium]|nr:MAG: hypothetical protein DMG49_23395 [Acidobacteriota bacterium]